MANAYEQINNMIAPIKQIDNYLYQVNNRFVNVEKQIVNLGYSTKDIEKISNEINQINSATESLGRNLEKINKRKLSISDINVLLQWAKQLISFVDVTGKLNSSCTNLGKVLSAQLMPAINAIATGIQFVANNWQIIQPLLITIVSVLGMYALALNMTTIATKALAIAQMVLNSAIFIFLAKILAVVAIFYAVIGVINLISGKSISATGIIIGLIYATVQIMKNVLTLAWNNIADFVNGVVNVFHNFKSIICGIWYDVQSVVLGVIYTMMQGIEAAINKIPGVQKDLTSGLREQLEAARMAADKAHSEYEFVEIMQTKTRGSLTDAYSKGYSIGAAGFKSGSVFSANNTLDSINNSTAMVAANTAQMNNSLEVSSEDLSYLRDLAEMEAINRFTTAQIKVDMTNNNRIDSDRDIDSVMDQFAMRLMGALNTVKEGV